MAPAPQRACHARGQLARGQGLFEDDVSTNTNFRARRGDGRINPEVATHQHYRNQWRMSRTSRISAEPDMPGMRSSVSMTSNRCGSAQNAASAAALEVKPTGE